MAALSEDALSPPLARWASPNAALWILLLLVVAVFGHTLAALARVWINSADYQHGVLIAPIGLALLYSRRTLIAGAPVRRYVAALPLLAAVLCGWLIAYRANSELLQQLAFPIAAWLTILAALGPSVARIAAFPIGYLYLAIPVWSELTPLLQWMSANVAESLLAWVGVTTQVEGFNVSIPEGQFMIVEGCSGRRYLLIAMATAVLMAGLERMRPWRAASFVIGACVAALVTNWVRIVIVIYAGHVSNMQHYLVAVEHTGLGYALYAPLLLGILWVGKRLSGAQARPSTNPKAQAAQPIRLRNMTAPIVMLLLAAAILAIPPGVDDRRLKLATAPLLTGLWHGPMPPRADWQPRYHGKKDEFRASYVHGARRIDVYVNVYGVQSPGSELVHFDNSVVPADAWTVVRPLNGDMPFDMFIATGADGSRWVFAQTYCVGGRATHAGGAAQVLYGIAAALGRPVPSGLLALAMPCGDDCNAAAASVHEFWNAHGDALAAMIPKRLEEKH